MNILLIHQNFPGQYKHLGPALAARGDRVVALTPKVKEPTTWQGIRVVPYPIRRGTARDVHPWLADFETKVIRAEACHAAAGKLAAEGFVPDVILGHHGWGEPMFLKDVWPGARLGLYCELYHSAAYPHLNFDPEFPGKDPGRDALRIRLRNLNNMMHEQVMDAGISPTRFQADTFPAAMRDRIDVIHDGIDTGAVRPNPDATLDLGEGLTVSRADEVITFINRNLEPYRGYHVFMRALPEILKHRPDAHVVLLGGDEVSYGARPPEGQSWKQIFIDEVRGRIPTPSWQRVHFLGRVPYGRFLSLMQVSRAHVYLTYPFVLSWSLLEAMSAGAAIVASETAPVKEVLTEGETGLMVDFFDRAALVDRLCALLDDAALRERLGSRARAFAREHYDLNSVCLPRQLDWVDRLATLPVRRPD
ncbi:glycosyltransferase [Aquicoccus sp. SCR17]|nr:glycosyltransferase [Carideicomes alvinocaridis]